LGCVLLITGGGGSGSTKVDDIPEAVTSFLGDNSRARGGGGGGGRVTTVAFCWYSDRSRSVKDRLAEGGAL
jgi:hypothetical protein